MVIPCAAKSAAMDYGTHDFIFFLIASFNKQNIAKGVTIVSIHVVAEYREERNRMGSWELWMTPTQLGGAVILNLDIHLMAHIS